MSIGSKKCNVPWPGGAQFVFTIFDDTDSQSLERGKPVYSLLHQLGFRTTKSVWVSRTSDQQDCGGTCDDVDYLAWLKELQEKGFEIGWHMASATTSLREQTIEGLERFKKHFGKYPATMANHYDCNENIYFGDARLSGINKLLYNLLTKFRNHNVFKGDVEGNELFWGDHCRAKIKYVRNFVFEDINTLKQCSHMPYHDADRPWVNKWFAASEGANVTSFNNLLTNEAIDRLEDEGGACIIYTHFGLGFYDEQGRALNDEFSRILNYISKKNVWLPTVSELLDFLESVNGRKYISKYERFIIEMKWLKHKIFFGSA